MSCREWTVEVVECARSGATPGSALQTHLGGCAECHARWESEKILSTPMRTLRAVAAGERCSDAGRKRLMEEFARVHRPAFRARWVWGLAAAAVMVLALAWGWSRQPTPAAIAVAEQVMDDSGFVPIPFAAPLATGEFVSVVRTELYAGALLRMGVSAPAGSGQYPVDVMVGQDGLPRAVRVLEDVNF